MRKLLQFPIPRVTFNTHGLFQVSFGFGFDPKTNDYRVVRILSIFGSPLDFVNSQPVVEVYSLFVGEWRMLSASASLPPICAIISLGPPAFANGALHWIAITNEKKLLFWCSIWGTRSSAKYCCQNFQGRLGGLVFQYMEIPLLCFK